MVLKYSASYVTWGPTLIVTLPLAWLEINKLIIKIIFQFGVGPLRQVWETKVFRKNPLFSETRHFWKGVQIKRFWYLFWRWFEIKSLLKGKAFAKKNGVFQSIFKATPFEARRGQEFIKQNPFTIVLFDKSFENHFGNKSILEEGSDSLLNWEGPATRKYS